jgi:hypothetical protein
MVTHRSLLFFAFSVTAWLAVVFGSQATPPAELSDQLRTRLRDERFQIVTSIRGLPLGVRSEMQTLFGTLTLDIAEPGESFHADGASDDPKLPNRRLVLAGCSYERCLVYYQRGGASPTWRVALFRWRPDATRLEWGSTAPGGLMTIDDVRSAILSGAIKGSVSGTEW